jgi:hypothetical protein
VKALALTIDLILSLMLALASSHIGIHHLSPEKAIDLIFRSMKNIGYENEEDKHSP